MYEPALFADVPPAPLSPAEARRQDHTRKRRRLIYSQYEADLEKILPLVKRADASAKVVLAQKQILTQVGTAPGDAVEMEYYSWEDPGQLATRSTHFRVGGVLPLAAAVKV